ncbi:MAG: hypothetical protein OXT09_11250 [Myxococcales bacterium]|nr:hypothetical protein [Myxococcales bacterium]
MAHQLAGGGGRAELRGWLLGLHEQGNTDWQVYNSRTVYLDIDTSACTIPTTPKFFPTLGGRSRHWVTRGVVSPYRVSPDTFRLHVWYPHAITPGDVNGWDWHVRWSALP